MLWVLLFAAIAVGGVLVLGRVVLRVWRSATGLLEEVDVLARRAGELADLLARVEVTDPAPRTALDPAFDVHADQGWPGTVESYDDRGAPAPGK